MPENKVLSASRIKTLEDCAWKYWCNYHLKVPQKGNDGASRGTVCHRIFELLLLKKNKKYFDVIIDQKSTTASPAVCRLTRMLLKQEGQDAEFYNEENYQLCLDMIYVGLNFDFFGKGGEPDKPEIKFVIEKENPEYKVMGFMDKVLKFDDKIKIVDYKSSKRKFSKEDLKANMQAMVYTLASKELWPKNLTTLVEFVFLKFPKQPLQQVEVSDDQLKGFEHYLAHMYKVINNFTEEMAKQNYAKDKYATKFFCRSDKSGWKCPYLEKFDYYILLSEEGKILKSAFKKKDLTASDGQKIEKKTYEGCPAHTADDPFDI
mgnify:CR=1 FL=1|tara:strand:- start:6162 stop:7115 length:954 start_codon:yes stop_codon:yes gene_type:complete